ncbi:GL25513 [Drosophila persimilis]|uniref:GL25513 n=1 Tax=Drosophila persimilis TaxID=7234 RepID=B4GJF3_DROPE|nr:GL25513 [Drosophila persimilis]
MLKTTGPSVHLLQGDSEKQSFDGAKAESPEEKVREKMQMELKDVQNVPSNLLSLKRRYASLAS